MQGRDAHQALPPAHIPQERAAELLLGPVVAVQAGGGLERADAGGVGHASPPTGPQEDGLERAGPVAVRCEAAAAGCAADRGPAGGAEVGAVVAGGIDDGLQQQRLKAVALAAAGGQAPDAQGEGLGGEVGAVGGGARLITRRTRLRAR